jgi:ATP-dependent Lon protease
MTSSILKKLRRVLDEDHYGLRSIKERILEHLAVHKLVGKIRAQSFVLVGPPGVGKTSLGKSIADLPDVSSFVSPLVVCAMKPKFVATVVRTSALCQVRSFSRLSGWKSNPVFLLDEIDKMSQTSAATQVRHYLKFSTQSRTTRLTITTSMSITICRR